MRNGLLNAGVVAVGCVICLSFAQEKSPPKAAPKTAATEKKTGKETTVKPKNAEAADLQAIRESIVSFVKSYNQGNAKEVAEHFTADAEYVDQSGRVSVGQEAIAHVLEDMFQESAGSTLTVTIESIRFLGPGLAIEDGTSSVTSSAGGPPQRNRYAAIHLKENGQWRMASVRDAADNARQHHDQIQALDWLIGDWVDEDSQSIMQFSCRPSDDGAFLLREFTVKIAGAETMHGSQRFGWDPMARHLRAWTFDSHGGFADGIWYRDGDRWVLKSQGVNADGEATSATTVFTPVNAHTITWQALEVVIGGERLPDTKVLTIVRKPPQPQQPAN